MTLFWRVSVVIVSVFLLLPPAVATSPERSFKFPSFPLTSCLNGGLLICMQNSSVRPGGYLALIPEPADGMDPNLLENNVGRVLYSSPAISWPANFDTNFTVLIKKNPNASGFGDGMAFVMTNDKRPSPKGSIGGLLGLFGPSTKRNTTGQLAVEIDTFSNEYDQDGDFHVGLDISTIFNNDSAPLSVANVDLAKQKPITYRIRYDGWSKQLEIMAGYADDSPLKSVHNWSVVIASINVTYVGFSAASGPSDDYSESIRVLSWYFSYTPLPEDSLASPAGGKSKQGVKRKVAIALAVLFASCFLGLVVFFGAKRFMKWRRWRWLESLSRSAACAPKMYTYEKLSKATRSFSSANLLGKGGFGSVYRGHLSSPPSVVAVKKISAASKQGEREYFAEICTIGRLRHKNIVQLQGWCHSGKSLLLVYEFMANGSLDRHIAAGTLCWPMRHRVLLGLASALLYLHEECGGTVVHRDVKPNNVLLDADFEAHLGDFGLARLAQGTDRCTSTTVLAGTLGYLAPEFGYTGKATPESDMFSYGIVVLEVVSGRRSLLGLDDNNILDHVWDLYVAGELLDAVDPRLAGKFDEEEVKRALMLGLMCAYPNPSQRLKSRQVVEILSNPNAVLMAMPEGRPKTSVPPALRIRDGFGGVAAMSNSAEMTTCMSPHSFSSTLLGR